MPTMMPRSPGIDMKQPKFLIIHNPQDMTVSANHQRRPDLRQLLFQPPRISTRISTNMSQQHPCPLRLKLKKTRTNPSNLPMINISIDSTNHRHNSRQPIQHIHASDIPRVPHLIAIPEILHEPLVPT